MTQSSKLNQSLKRVGLTKGSVKSWKQKFNFESYYKKDSISTSFKVVSSSLYFCWWLKIYQHHWWSVTFTTMWHVNCLFKILTKKNGSSSMRKLALIYTFINMFLRYPLRYISYTLPSDCIPVCCFMLPLKNHYFNFLLSPSLNWLLNEM